MKKVWINIIAAAMPLLAYPQSAPPPPESFYQFLQNGQLYRWVYAWGDEFDGNVLDKSKWGTDLPWGRSLVKNGEQQYYAPDNANHYLQDGILHLVARNEPGYRRVLHWEDDNYILPEDQGPNLRFFPYTSGMIYSHESFLYGLYEIRLKTSHHSKGLWPAFWLYSGQCKAEIDFTELKGERPTQTHYGVVCSWDCDNENDCEGHWRNATGDFADDFNVIQGDWQSGGTVFMLNGQAYGQIDHTFTRRMNIVANLAVASDGGSFKPGPDESTVFPTELQIDFIRVWSRVDCTEPIWLPFMAQTPYSPSPLTGRYIELGGSPIPAQKAWIPYAENLTVIGTEYVKLLPGFQSFKGSIFNARVAPCPLPPQKSHTLQTHGTDSEKDHTGYGPLLIAEDTATGISLHEQNHASSENRDVVFTASVYPNPSRGLVTVELNGQPDRYFRIELISSTGTVVYSNDKVSGSSITIDASTYGKGVYYLRCTFGSNFTYQKVILE